MHGHYCSSSQKGRHLHQVLKKIICLGCDTGQTPVSRGMGYSYWLAWVICSPEEWVPESQGALKVLSVSVCVSVCGGGEMANSKRKGWWPLKRVPSTHRHFRHNSQRSFPQPPNKTEKALSATQQKLRADCSSIPVSEHLHCKTKKVQFGFGTQRFSSLGNSSTRATEDTLQLCENHSPFPPQLE